MDTRAIRQAADLLAKARRSGEPLERLPPDLRPRDAAEAYAIQLALLEETGESLAGWKVAISPDYGLMAGILVRSRMFESGAEISSKPFRMLGVEAEIAFRFDVALAARDRAYERAEVAAAVTALPAIEIVDTRFASYDGTPVIERAADFMSNGALVAGPTRADWRAFDLERIEASVAIDGAEIVRRVGGNACGDPMIPAVALVNQLRLSGGTPSGMVVTTGTYTGLEYARGDSAVRAGFAGFGAVALKFIGS
jgi:2-keto-4-pentenoate hydratase